MTAGRTLLRVFLPVTVISGVAGGCTGGAWFPANGGSYPGHGHQGLYTGLYDPAYHNGDHCDRPRPKPGGCPRPRAHNAGGGGGGPRPRQVAAMPRRPHGGGPAPKANRS